MAEYRMRGDNPTLDDVLRRHFTDDLAPGEVLTTWVAVAATRSADGGGVVLTDTSDNGGLPQWEVRGLLSTALRMVDRSEDTDQDGDQ